MVEHLSHRTKVMDSSPTTAGKKLEIKFHKREFFYLCLSAYFMEAFTSLTCDIIQASIHIVINLSVGHFQSLPTMSNISWQR